MTVETVNPISREDILDDLRKRHVVVLSEDLRPGRPPKNDGRADEFVLKVDEVEVRVRIYWTGAVTAYSKPTFRGLCCFPDCPGVERTCHHTRPTVVRSPPLSMVREKIEEVVLFGLQSRKKRLGVRKVRQNKNKIPRVCRTCAAPIDFAEAFRKATPEQRATVLSMLSQEEQDRWVLALAKS